MLHHFSVEPRRSAVQAAVQQPHAQRLNRQQGQALRHQRARCLRPQAPRQGIGPVFRAVEVAHVAVVGVEHHTTVGPDLVRRQRQEHAAGPGIAAQHRHRDPVCGFDQLARHIVHRIDVVPGLVGGAGIAAVRSGLDAVEVDAVAEKVAPAEQQQHARVTLLCLLQGSQQTHTLLGGHGAVVKVKREAADPSARRPHFAVTQLGPFIVRALQWHRPRRQRRRLSRKCQRGGQLEGRSVTTGAGQADLSDPDAAIMGAPQQGAITLRHHRARRNTLERLQCRAAGRVSIE